MTPNGTKSLKKFYTQFKFSYQHMQSKFGQYYQQEEPRLGNQYLEDSSLVAILKRLFPSQILSQIEPDLIKFGERVSASGDIIKYGRDSERNPPQLIHYNAWGRYVHISFCSSFYLLCYRRVDDIHVAHGWKRLAEIIAEEGLMNIGYERHFDEYSRLYQFVKTYLFSPSGFVSDCPLAMTDGAARLIELNVDSIKDFNVKRKIQETYRQLISKDPAEAISSGQWMTEKTGGSDIGDSETIAKDNGDGTYSLYGYKFFTSATTSAASFLLARVVDKDGKSKPGSRGLSVFFLEMRNPDGQLNNILIHKLKNKLGTKAVPTAELELCGSKAYLIGDSGSGVKIIASILNITRIHNAITMVGMMRRGIAIARDYASRRKVFGKVLSNQPLHLTTLSQMECEFRGALQLVLDVSLLLGKTECNKATEEEHTIFRLLTPMTKLYTAKQAIAITSEAIESLGGAGYMEDSDMPRLLRDSQVGSIWEGTTNVLSMDLWRPILKERGLVILSECITKKLKSISSSLPRELTGAEETLTQALSYLTSFAMKYGNKPSMVEANARNFAYGLTRIYISTLLLEQVAWSRQQSPLQYNTQADIFVAHYWIFQKRLTEPLIEDVAVLNTLSSIAMDKDPSTDTPRGTGDYDINNRLRSKY